jgi:hypothetical protein
MEEEWFAEALELLGEKREFQIRYSYCREF